MKMKIIKVVWIFLVTVLSFISCNSSHNNDIKTSTGNEFNSVGDNGISGVDLSFFISPSSAYLMEELEEGRSCKIPAPAAASSCPLNISTGYGSEFIRLEESGEYGKKTELFELIGVKEEVQNPELVRLEKKGYFLTAKYLFVPFDRDDARGTVIHLKASLKEDQGGQGSGFWLIKNRGEIRTSRLIAKINTANGSEGLIFEMLFDLELESPVPLTTSPYTPHLFKDEQSLSVEQFLNNLSGVDHEVAESILDHQCQRFNLGCDFTIQPEESTFSLVSSTCSLSEEMKDPLFSSVSCAGEDGPVTSGTVKSSDAIFQEMAYSLNSQIMASRQISYDPYSSYALVRSYNTECIIGKSAEAGLAGGAFGMIAAELASKGCITGGVVVGVATAGGGFAAAATCGVIDATQLDSGVGFVLGSITGILGSMGTILDQCSDQNFNHHLPTEGILSLPVFGGDGSRSQVRVLLRNDEGDDQEAEEDGEGSVADKLEEEIAHLPPNEKVARIRETADRVADKKGWDRNKVLERKNRGRRIYSDRKNHYSVDTQHGRLEKHNQRGKHLGEYDMDLRPTKEADPSGGHDIITK